MAKYFKSKTKKRILTALSAALAVSFSLGVFAACADQEDNEDDTPVSKTDTQLLKNGNFEFYSDNNLTELDKKRSLISTPDNWSRSTGSDNNGNSAASSDTASGIINTSEWDYIAKPGKPFATKEDKPETWKEEATAHWKDAEVTAYDRVKFYEDNDINSKDDFELYGDYNYSVDYEDLQYLSEIENPGTHSSTTEGSSVLMIHNRRKTNDAAGTAQYYTSSSTITLSAGTAAELSVWVKTAQLTHYFNEMEADGVGGAYIGVTNTVGGTTLPQMQIKNINTKGVTENNGWKEYKLYVRASTFATSTFRIVLGLGFGSTTDMYETVNGYAFFDDLTCNIISSSEYEEKIGTGTVVATPKDTAEQKKFDTSSDAYKNKTSYALDLYAGFTDFNLTKADSLTFGLTEEKYNNFTYTTATYPTVKLDEVANSYKGYAPFNELNQAAAANEYLRNVLDNDFKKVGELPGDNTVLLLMSANGVPYTAKTGEFTLPAGERKLISFFVKTSKMNGFTGAGVSLVDGDNKTSITSVDTTTLSTVDIDEDHKDIYDGWVQCFFFITNDTKTDKTYSLEFTYGPTTIVGSTRNDYLEGYAAFTGFETYDMTKAEAGYASTGDRAKNVSLTNTNETERKFDDVILNDPDSIETGVTLPANYWGVNGGSKLVGGTQDDYFNNAPAGVTAGLINSKHADVYATQAWKNTLTAAAGKDGANWWNDIIGAQSNQPLMILNDVEAAYGFIGDTRPSVSASAYQRISVRVKVSANAKATVYLVDADDLSSSLPLNVPKVTYWYDDNGNICTKDPSDEEYNKNKDIAYTLQKNGLYTKVNGNDNVFFANLANYDKDDDGNYITSDKTIAYYYNEADGKYYAYYDEDKNTYSTEVNDLDHGYARYDHTETKMPQAEITVDGAKVADKWVTVSFYVHTGNAAKSYRLEVWSGTRNGSVKNPKGSYVFFDTVTSSDVSSDYSNILNLATENVKDNLNLGEDDKIEDKKTALYYTFTFYDSASYLRYDETLDTEKEGNPYGSYKQSDKSETMIYLYAEDNYSHPTEQVYRMFVDYSASEVTVDRDATNGDDNNDNDDTTTPENEANVWLLIASGALVFVLLFVFASLIVQRALKNRARKAPVQKAKPAKRVKPAKAAKEEPEEEPAPETPKKDENDPYDD